MPKTAWTTPIPNELFSYELKKRRWTEVYVAVQIGVPDKNTVGRWKRGEAVPSDYYKEKLVELFGKSIDKLGWPDENKISNGNLNYHPPTPLFTGREDTLNWLHDGLALRGRYDLLSVQALTGLNGVGKSQIASKYAHTFMNKYHTIMWLQAENSTVLARDFAAIASHIGLPEQYEINQQKRIDAVIKWLTHEEITRWLLIFDSADDPVIIKEILQRYIPRPCQGHVIITTRSSATGEIIQRKEVDPFSIEESAHFLLRRTKKSPFDANITLAKAIAEELGRLPLALEQAGAYIEEKPCGLAGYLKRYQSTARKKLLRYKGNLTVYPHSPIASTLSLSFEEIQKANSTAIDLLSLFAFLAPDGIPEEFVRNGADALSPNLQAIKEHPDLLDDAIGELSRYSIISRYPETETCSIHRLVQICIIDGMDEDTQQLWIERAVKVVIQTDLNNFTRQNLVRYFLPHAQECLNHIRQWNMKSLDAARLVHLTGENLSHKGEYEQSKRLLQQAHYLYEMNVGSDHLVVAINLSDLAGVNETLGNIPLAETLYLQALSIFERTLAPMSLDICSTLVGLAKCYLNQGKYEQAEYFYKRCLDIANKITEVKDCF